MANKDDIETDLTLELDGTRVTPEKFLKAVSSFVGLVHELAKEAAGDQQAPEWTIKVKSGSALVGLQPMPGYNPAIVQSVLAKLKPAIKSIEEGKEAPDNFSEKALVHLRALASVPTPDKPEVFVRVWVKKEPVKVDNKLAANLTNMLGLAYDDYGSVEGLLQVVSERGNNRSDITDPLTGKAIKCYLNHELLQTALSLFGQRVEAYGQIHYRADGTIIGINVDEFVSFPPPDKIPSFKDVQGILRESLGT